MIRPLPNTNFQFVQFIVKQNAFKQINPKIVKFDLVIIVELINVLFILTILKMYNHLQQAVTL